MGYEVHFKGMPEDVMEKYNKKNKFFTPSTHGENKLALEIFILRNPIDGNDPKEIRDAAFQIKLLLGGMQLDIEKNEEQFAYDRWKEEEGDLWYCGWQWCENKLFNHHQNTNEEIYDYVVEKLSLLKFCTTTEDFFEDNSNFSEKLEEIKSVLDYFEDTIRDNKILEIQKQLSEYRIPDDEDEEKEENLEEKDK